MAKNRFDSFSRQSWLALVCAGFFVLSVPHSAQSQIEIITIDDPARAAQTGRAAPPSFSPVTTVRGGAHAAYDRLVFDFSAPENAQVTRTGNQLTIRFNKAYDFSFNGVNTRALKHIRALRQASDGSVTIDLASGDTQFTTSKAGQKLVLDFKGPVIAAPAPAQASPKKSPAAAPAAKNIDEPPPLPGETEAKDKVQAPTDTLQTSAPRLSRDAARNKAEQTIRQKYADRIEATAPAKEGRIALSSTQPLNMAIFVRNNYLWLATDQKESGVQPQLSGALAADLGKPIRIMDDKKTAEAYIYKLPEGYFPTATRSDFKWQITLNGEPNLVTPLSVETLFDRDKKGPVEDSGRIIVSTNSLSRIYRFKDPVIGDNLWVVPTTAPGHGIVRERRYPELEILPTNTGVAVKLFSSGVEMSLAENGKMTISSQAGINLSTLNDSLPSQLAQSPGDEDDDTAHRLFDFSRWVSSSPAEFNESRRIMERRISGLTEANRTPELINLAKLHFANGFAHEALGLLSLATRIKRELLNNPSLTALRGAAAAYSDKYNVALKDLEHEALKEEPEAALWRGYVYARQNLWKQAYDEFSKTGGLVGNYPDPIRSDLAFAMAETSLNQKDLRNARLLLEMLDRKEYLTKYEEAKLGYLNGLVALYSDEPERAEYMLNEVRNGPDRQYRAKASLMLTRMRMEDDRLTGKDAAEELEKLRFIWRDDDLEIEVLKELGQAYFDYENFKSGFETLQYAANLLPDNHPEKKQLQDKITQTFHDLYIGDGADKLPALAALATFNQFRDLNPKNEDGDKAIQKLADRMVQIDLLDRAAKLLEHQIKFRLQGEEKARVGAKLAGIRLLDRDPDSALSALNNTIVDGISSELALERQLLKARALSQLNKPDDALALLVGLDNEMAHRLKIDINWRAGRWMEAAMAFSPLIDMKLREKNLQDTKLDRVPDDLSDLILNQSVAYILAGDLTALAKVNQEFGDGMMQSKNAALFRLLVRSPKPGQLADLKTLQSHVGEVDMFKSFLDAYKQTN